MLDKKRPFGLILQVKRKNVRQKAIGEIAVQNGNQLPLERCPHCNVAKPRLDHRWHGGTESHAGTAKRNWWIYVCATCGGCVMTVEPAGVGNAQVKNIWPNPRVVAEEIPDRAREYLSQAISSMHAPSGAVMLTASAVDAMLKDKGFTEGTLYTRIDEAATAHLITDEMAAWAHEVRLDANDQRHADESAGLPDEADATRVIEFASALAQFLYVLPARVARGRQV